MKESSIVVNGVEIPTVLAITDSEQQRGLMYCENLPASMSFVYDYPKINKFWMKNTPKELDIVFCLSGKIIHIAKGVPFSTALVGPDAPTDLVVEFPYGTCERLNIQIGDKIEVKGVETFNFFQKKLF